MGENTAMPISLKFVELSLRVLVEWHFGKRKREH
jgi:hypothetical protein